MLFTKADVVRFLSTTMVPYKQYYAVLGLVTVFQLCPIWLTDYPAMHDYPNHLARAHILYQYNDVDSYRTLYERDWDLVPNLAIDLIVPALLHIVSIETASKIFLSLIVVLFNLGLHLLGIAVIGRPHWSALAATYFTFNYAFAYGFVNYMFGLGVFFLTLATWMQMRGAWTGRRVALVAVLTLACYYSHLSSFVFLSVAVAFLSVLHLTKTRHLRSQDWMGLLPLLPASVAYLSYISGIEHQAPMDWQQDIVMKKLVGFLYPFVSYNLPVELALTAACIGIGGLIFLRRMGGCVSKELLLLGSLFVLLYLLAPFSAAQSHYVDRRFLIPAAAILLMGLNLNLSKTWSRYLMIVLVLLSIGRVATVWHSWTKIGREIRAQVHMLDALPEKVKVFPILMYEKSGAIDWLWDMHFYYSSHYATIYRHAYVPTIYAWKSVNPIHLKRSEPDQSRVERGTPIERVNWNRILSEYDYVWGYELSDEYKRYLTQHGRLVVQSNGAVLVKVNR